MGIRCLAGGRGALGIWLFAGALLLVQTMACSARQLPTPASGPPPDVGEILRQSVSRLLALDSLAFTLEQQEGTTTLIGGVEMRKAYGVVDIPDKFNLTVEAELASPRIFLKIGVVVIGDQAYMTNLLSGEWGQVSMASVPVNFRNLGQTLADITKAIKAPVLVGSERLGDRETHHIKGTIQSEELSGLVPGASQEFTVNLDIWLDQADKLLVQAVILGKVLPTDIPNSRRLLILDDFDVPVDITAPE